MRREIEPGSTSKCHLTLLPPRHLDCPSGSAVADIQAVLQEWEAFEVTLSEVQIFPLSRVLYLSVSQGFDKLLGLHRALNRGNCGCQEVFYYHPHVTLAQSLPVEKVDSLRATAQERWRGYPAGPTFLLERLTLVQNTAEHGWQNLHEMFLRSPVSV
jgi:2'-5' RNA ligase